MCQLYHPQLELLLLRNSSYRIRIEIVFGGVADP